MLATRFGGEPWIARCCEIGVKFSPCSPVAGALSGEGPSGRPGHGLRNLRQRIESAFRTARWWPSSPTAKPPWRSCHGSSRRWWSWTAGAFNSIARNVNINTGGQLTAFDVANAFAGSTIFLNGGTARFGRDTYTDPYPAGGNFVVQANSQFDSYNAVVGYGNLTHQYGTLDFAAANPVSYPNGYVLDLTDTGVSYNFGPSGVRSCFTGAIISQNGAIQVTRIASTGDGRGLPTLEFNNTSIRAGKKVAVKTVSSTAGSLIGSLGVATLGGAELLTSNAFTMFSFPTSSFALNDISIFDTTNSLWTKSGTTTITATLAAGSAKGSIPYGQSASFTSANAGYVSLTGPNCPLMAG